MVRWGLLVAGSAIFAAAAYLVYRYGTDVLVNPSIIHTTRVWAELADAPEAASNDAVLKQAVRSVDLAASYECDPMIVSTDPKYPHFSLVRCDGGAFLVREDKVVYAILVPQPLPRPEL